MACDLDALKNPAVAARDAESEKTRRQERKSTPSLPPKATAGTADASVMFRSNRRAKAQPTPEDDAPADGPDGEEG